MVSTATFFLSNKRASTLKKISGKLPSSKKIASTSSSIKHLLEEQQAQDRTIQRQQDTSPESLSPPPSPSSSTYIKKSTFSGPAGTKLINSPETPEKSEPITVYAAAAAPPMATNSCTIFRDQIVNDGVRELSTRYLDEAEEDKNNNANVSSSLLSPYVDTDYRFPIITENDEPNIYGESSKPTVYWEQYVYHLNNLRNLGNIREQSSCQKRKLDDSNNNEQNIDRQDAKRQERPFKRTNVTKVTEHQNNNKGGGLDGQDWKSVLCECIVEYRKHLDAEEKNLTMLITILRRLQKLYALAVKSINKTDEDMQSSSQVHPSDALDKYNQSFFDAMATVNKDS